MTTLNAALRKLYPLLPFSLATGHGDRDALLETMAELEPGDAGNV